MWIWVVPAAILLVAAVPALLLISRLAEEARRLTGALRAVSELRPAMVELRADVRTTQAAAAHLRRRT